MTKYLNALIERLEAENARLRGLLEEFVDVNDEPCWRDHHGYCQAHFLEESCLVERSRKALEGRSDTGDFVRIPVEAYEFLMGQGPLEGCQFGERHPDRPGAFWWRAVIREREPAEPSDEEVKRVARAIYGERDFDRIGADVQEQMFLVSRKAIAALRGGA